MRSGECEVRNSECGVTAVIPTKAGDRFAGPETSYRADNDILLSHIAIIGDG